jgi:hypothetical protein
VIWAGVSPGQRPFVLAGAVIVVIVAAAAAAKGQTGAAGLVLDLVVLTVVAAFSLALLARPWLAPWGVVLLFPLTAELQLRVTYLAGVSKDALAALLVAVAVFHVRRTPWLIRRLRPTASAFAALAVVVGLYVLDPGGGHDSGWAFGTRLLVEGLGLLVVGLTCPRPDRAVRHLVRATCVITAFEGVFAWIQQSAGLNSLVYTWGYEYGSQVRQTSSGGLRTSGTFADPFQLVALGLLALCLAAFVSTNRVETIVLVVSALALLGATQVRTAFVQVALVAFLYALRRRWFVPTAAVVCALAAIGIFAGLTITTAPYPGGPRTPLLLGLNGRSTAWSLAVTSPKSLLVGHGVGAVGTGSDRAAGGLVTKASAYDPTKAPTAVFAGDTAFLDSSYAQVQSDVGLAGVAGLGLWIGALLARLRRPLVRGEGPRQQDARWGALAVLSVSAVDWIGRSSLASYTTGFLTLYVLGLLVAAAAARADQEDRRRLWWT